MGKYRTYKNGIHGRRYRGFYVVKKGEKEFDVIEEDGTLIVDGMQSLADCEWEIDKITNPPEIRQLTLELYTMQIYDLVQLHKDAQKKCSEQPENEDYRKACDLVYSVLYRKTHRKPY